MYRFGMVVAALALVGVARADESERMQLFDEKLVPFVKEMQWPPQLSEVQSLQEILKEFEALRKPKKEVVPLEPMWLRLKLAEAGVRKAVIGLCGAELPSCDEVREKLRQLTSECSGIFLGTIDVAKHPETPRDLYDATDPTFIMLLALNDSKTLQRVGIMGTRTPITVAAVMCPEERFKYIFRTPGF